MHLRIFYVGCIVRVYWLLIERRTAGDVAAHDLWSDMYWSALVRNYPNIQVFKYYPARYYPYRYYPAKYLNFDTKPCLLIADVCAM